MRTRNLYIYPLLCAFSLLLLSCDGKRKEKAQQVVTQFHQAYKSEDLQEAVKLYPNITELKGDFYKTDELEIKSVCILPSKDIMVVGENKWTNGFGKTNTRTMKFFVREFEDDGKKEYKIYDSKNFVGLTDTKLYKIGLKGGAFNLSCDTTDVSLSRKIRDMEPTYNAMVRAMRSQMSNGFSYTGFNWETAYYSNYASGSCSVTNSSGFPIKNPRYIIRYRKKKDGDVVATDDGNVCYGWFYPGDTKRVSWFTSNVPSSAHWANIEIVLDPSDDWIEEIIEAQSFTGTEFRN
ncbi:MAG: hypothetical protein PUF26_04455 [Bacteroidales bacterium]|nr:hypothetical protein [Bacteroidales bacterium]MDD7726375.1 hypothetical protein [Bacteroidales bacterium]